MSDENDALQPHDYMVVVILLIVTLFWGANLGFLIRMYRLLSVISATLKENDKKETDTQSRDHSIHRAEPNTSCPNSDSPALDLARYPPTEPTSPLFQTGASVLVPSHFSSTPDLNNVYDEIPFMSVSRRYLRSGAPCRTASHKRRRYRTNTSKTADSSTISGGTFTSITSQMASGMSCSIEESAVTPSTAFDRTKLFTFGTQKLNEAAKTELGPEPHVTPFVVCPNQADGLTNAREDSDAEDEEDRRLTYMNMDKIIAKGSSNEGMVSGEYVPMAEVLYKKSRLIGTIPIEPHRPHKGFYIGESSKWSQSQPTEKSASVDIELAEAEDSLAGLRCVLRRAKPV